MQGTLIPRRIRRSTWTPLWLEWSQSINVRGIVGFMPFIGASFMGSGLTMVAGTEDGCIERHLSTGIAGWQVFCEPLSDFILHKTSAPTLLDCFTLIHP